MTIARRPIASIEQVDGLRRALSMRGASDSLNAALREGACTSIQVISDSTGNATDEWVYLVAEKFADDHPTYTVRHRLFNATNRNYDAPTVIQSGASGQRYARLDRSTNCYLYLADESAHGITGDIDVRFYGTRASLADQDLISKFGAAGNRSWRFMTTSTGGLNFVWTADGSTQIWNNYSSANPTWPNDTPLWVRATLTVADGTVRYYTSSDGATWTQLGSTRGGAGATSIYDSTATIKIGSYEGVALLAGDVYEVRVLDGINGYDVVPRYPDAWRVYRGVVFGGAPTLDIFNASVAGAGLEVYFDASAERRRAMLPPEGHSLVLVATSHNDNGTTSPAFLDQYATYLTNLKALLPHVPIAVMSQNPETSPSSAVKNHEQRCVALGGWATLNGYGFIDVYKAFTESSTAIGDLVNPADGVHPTAAGSILWADTVYRSLTGA